jgi:hypothetical protein
MEPPDVTLLGSIQMTLSCPGFHISSELLVCVVPRLRIYLPKASIKVDFPAPGGQRVRSPKKRVFQELVELTGRMIEHVEQRC